MNALDEFNLIPISTASLQAIAESASLAKKALHAIPAVAVDDSVLNANLRMALESARAQLLSAHSVLEHLIERAAKCH